MKTDPIVREAVLVRSFVAYFGLYAVGIALDASEGTRRFLNATWGRLDDWFASAVFGVAPNAPIGAPLATISSHLLVLLCAAAAAILWSRLDPQPAVTERSHRLLRVALRYYVAVVTMLYAGFKIVPLQFPRPMLDVLTEPLGAITPMSFLWTFMGYSPVYVVFAGLVEWAGAFFLFFRRTTTLGALILVAAMTNVVLLNYSFGVFVKTLPTNLLLACLVLAAPDLKRLLDLLVRDRPTERSPLAASSRAVHASARLQRVRRYTKPLLVSLAAAGPIVVAALSLRSTSRPSPLYGVYELAAASTSSTSTPPTDWERVIFDRDASLSVVLRGGGLRRYRAAVDTVSRTVRYWKRSDRSDQLLLTYERPVEGGSLWVRQATAEAAAGIEYKAVNIGERYSLTRPFRWR